MIVAPGCYGATEISVTLTTNADCGAMVTQLFTGAVGTADFGTAAAAEQVSCEVASEGRIGTLSIVPSGARDDRFDVEAVAAVGVPASDCTALRTAGTAAAAPAPTSSATPKTTGCIVARRRLSFRPHRSLTLPIHLSASCIGVPCGSDQTCDLGVCSSTADCTDQGCPRERAAAGSPGVDAASDAAIDGPVDAAADAPVDAPDASVPRCGPMSEVVVTGQAIVGRPVMQGTDFVYVNGGLLSGTADPSEIRRVPRAGGAAAMVVRGASDVHTAGASYQAVAANGLALAWAERSTLVNLEYAASGTAPQNVSPGLGSSSAISMASLTGAFYVGFWVRSTGAGQVAEAFVMNGAMPVASASGVQLPGPVPEILVDPVKKEFFGVSNQTTLVRFGLEPTTNAPTELGWVIMTNVASDLARGKNMLYVASGASVSGGGSFGIYRIDPATITTGAGPARSPWLPSVTPQTMASDDAFLYYIAGTTLSRANLSATTVVSEPLAQTSAAVAASRLYVDDQCLYWIEGDTTIMKRAKK